MRWNKVSFIKVSQWYLAAVIFMIVCLIVIVQNEGMSFSSVVALVCCGAACFLTYYFLKQVMFPLQTLKNQLVESAFAKSQSLKIDNSCAEVKYLSAAIKLYADKVKKEIEEKQLFISAASHELKTPLTAITGQLEVTRMHQRQNVEYEVVLDSVLDDLRHLNNLTNGILSLASADGNGKGNEEVLRVDELLFEAREKVVKRKKSYVIILQFLEEVIDEEALRIKGNREMIISAFMNLMENGCKYSVDHQVLVTIGSTPRKIILRFIDCGKGIETEEIKNVFEPYYRAKETSDISGYGIGLTLSKKIIETHQGKIDISSENQIGTAVFIEFNRAIF